MLGGVAGLVLVGCDSYLAIEGTIQRRDADREPCRVELWTMMGPIWGKQSPTVRREGQAIDKIELGWTIGGPRDEHWVVVDCPGYVTYESERFEAPNATRKYDIGTVVLEPVRDDGSD